jgi:hypothetical protein
MGDIDCTFVKMREEGSTLNLLNPFCKDIEDEKSGSLFIYDCLNFLTDLLVLEGRFGWFEVGTFSKLVLDGRFQRYYFFKRLAFGSKYEQLASFCI